MQKTRAILSGFLCTLLCLLIAPAAFSQDTISAYHTVVSFPGKLFSAIDRKSQKAENNLDKATDRYLHKLAKQENKIRKKLLRKDPQLAQSLFPNVESTYAAVKAKVTQPLNSYSNIYSGHLDSLSTALSFLRLPAFLLPIRQLQQKPFCSIKICKINLTRQTRLKNI